MPIFQKALMPNALGERFFRLFDFPLPALEVRYFRGLIEWTQ